MYVWTSIAPGSDSCPIITLSTADPSIARKQAAVSLRIWRRGYSIRALENDSGDRAWAVCAPDGRTVAIMSLLTLGPMSEAS